MNPNPSHVVTNNSNNGNQEAIPSQHVVDDNPCWGGPQPHQHNLQHLLKIINAGGFSPAHHNHNHHNHHINKNTNNPLTTFNSFATSSSASYSSTTELIIPGDFNYANVVVPVLSNSSNTNNNTTTATNTISNPYHYYGGLLLHHDKDYIVLNKPPDLRMDGPHSATVLKLLAYWFPTPSIQERATLHELNTTSTSVSGEDFKVELPVIDETISDFEHDGIVPTPIATSSSTSLNNNNNNNYTTNNTTCTSNEMQPKIHLPQQTSSSSSQQAQPLQQQIQIHHKALLSVVSTLSNHSEITDNIHRPTHQLDYATSGVLLIAKSSHAARVACLAFEQRLAKKEYLAVVHGHFLANNNSSSSNSSVSNNKNLNVASTVASNNSSSSTNSSSIYSANTNSSSIPILTPKQEQILKMWLDGSWEQNYRKKRRQDGEAYDRQLRQQQQQSNLTPLQSLLLKPPSPQNISTNHTHAQQQQRIRSITKKSLKHFQGYMPPHAIFLKWKGIRIRNQNNNNINNSTNVNSKKRKQEQDHSPKKHKHHKKKRSSSSSNNDESSALYLLLSSNHPLISNELENYILDKNWRDVKKDAHLKSIFENITSKYNTMAEREFVDSNKNNNNTTSSSGSCILQESPHSTQDNYENDYYMDTTYQQKRLLPTLFRIRGEEQNAFYVQADLAERKGDFRVAVDPAALSGFSEDIIQNYSSQGLIASTFTSHLSTNSSGSGTTMNNNSSSYNDESDDYYLQEVNRNGGGDDDSSSASSSFKSPLDCENRQSEYEFKPCLTRCVVLRSGIWNGVPVSKVLLQPRTGRRHQLRLHMAIIGHPILGDATYELKPTSSINKTMKSNSNVNTLHTSPNKSTNNNNNNSCKNIDKRTTQNSSTNNNNNSNNNNSNNNNNNSDSSNNNNNIIKLDTNEESATTIINSISHRSSCKRMCLHAHKLTIPLMDEVISSFIAPDPFVWKEDGTSAGGGYLDI